MNIYEFFHCYQMTKIISFQNVMYKTQLMQTVGITNSQAILPWACMHKACSLNGNQSENYYEYKSTKPN